MNDNHRQANFRPWEASGAVRRDCEPHRGEVLRFFGVVSSGLGVVALACTSAFAVFVLILPRQALRTNPFMQGVFSSGALALLAGMAGAVVVWDLARKDLAAFRTGRLDLAGEPLTRSAQSCALAGAVLGTLGIVVLAIVAECLLLSKE